MILRSIVFLLLSVVSFSLRGQGNIKEGLAPKATIYLIEGDSIRPITHLKKNKENRIRVVLEGGIEKVQHTLYVTSKHASIKPDPKVQNQYIVTPLKEETAEIIVDIKTEEDYKQIRMVDKNGKQKKEVVKTLPAKTYMVGYEKVKIN